MAQGEHTLTTAYYMFSTVLVMPEDTEEMALTLNGKKRKITKSDFIKSITNSGIGEKVIDNISKKFGHTVPKWFELTRQWCQSAVHQTMTKEREILRIPPPETYSSIRMLTSVMPDAPCSRCHAVQSQ